MRVRWTRTALKNLAIEAQYIARDDPSAANRLIKRIRSAVQKLADYPALGKPGRVPGTRELAVGGTSYLIPYRVRAEKVEILRVFHTSRKWPEGL